jgi:cold shock CspA family protein
MPIGEMLGRVVTWRSDSGYGFICPDTGKASVFVHVKSVRNRQPLAVGDRVAYKIGQGRDGRTYAIDVVPCSAVPAQAMTRL